MIKLFGSIRTMLKIVFHIDKKSLLICIAYNLIKQLMNVFYGVYFIRMILVGLETRQSIGTVLAVLVLMFAVNVLFSKFDQYCQYGKF